MRFWKNANCFSPRPFISLAITAHLGRKVGVLRKSPHPYRFLPFPSDQIAIPSPISNNGHDSSCPSVKPNTASRPSKRQRTSWKKLTSTTTYIGTFFLSNPLRNYCNWISEGRFLQPRLFERFWETRKASQQFLQSCGDITRSKQREEKTFWNSSKWISKSPQSYFTM